MQPCKRRVWPPPGSPPAQGRSPPEQAQSEKSQGVRGTESPDSFDNTPRNRELRVRFFGGSTSEPHLHIHAKRGGDSHSIFDGTGVPLRFEGRWLVRNSLVRRREVASYQRAASATS